MRRSDAVAIVAVLVTAVVGLAGITAGWLSAREERSSQRALARDDRVFDRRAAAYLDAIGFLERQNDAYIHYAAPAGQAIPFPTAPDLLLKERLIAFGSTNVNREFQRAEDHALVTLDDVRNENRNGKTVIVRESGPTDLFYGRSLVDFQTEIARFERTVHSDLGG
jgi:hypothetical protein